VTSSLPATGAAPQTFDDADYEMLRAAVNLARQAQVRSLASLKRRLAELFPGREESIDRALQFWANYEASKRTLST
jgi:hypothetical protein